MHLNKRFGHELARLRRDVYGGSDDKRIGRGRRSGVPAAFTASETLDIGRDLGSCVSPACSERSPFPFSGAIQEVRVELTGLNQ
ncbi:hypothetical protein Pla108_18930 [Botrimarina colliarenosi]|uniref:Uncharacterized protein n=1 Tax=Botrimarina colliarenosi TaxID=2528001 RepID=A0A5C6AFA1_9BACT|nr:hypothetical protein Pla108_18930 [Botrimarina colliarenosi]